MDTQEEKLGPPESEKQEPKNLPKRSAAQRWVRILKIYLGTCLAVCAVVAGVLYHELQWPGPDGAFDTWDFGKSGTKGVTVPFTSPDGVIHIQGFIGNHPVVFTVDTGSSNSIVPKRLHIGTQYADASTMGDASANWVWTRPVFFPCVRIGGSMIHAFSAVVPDRRLLLAPIESGSTITDITLGNTALSHVVVTIDYSKHLITFQPPQQQPLPPLTKPSTGMRFTWPKGDTAFHNGAPFISGDTNHHPLNVILDTGTSGTIIIPASLKDILIKDKSISLTGRKMKTSMLFSVGTESQTTPLTVSLYPAPPFKKYSIIANAQVATGWSDPTCVLIGDDVMFAWIVTIDYPNRTITLTPRR